MPSGVFFFSSRRRHTRFDCDWSSDVCSSDLSFARSFRRSPGRSRTTVSSCVGERWNSGSTAGGDRKSVGQGKSGDLGGGRSIKKKKSAPWLAAEEDSSRAAGQLQPGLLRRRG